MPVYKVKFNKPVSFTDHTGVSFVKNPGEIDEETATGPFTTQNVSPTKDFAYYDVVWVTPIVAGDTVEFRYDSVTGNYMEDNAGYVLDMVGDSYIDVPVALSAASEGRLELTINFSSFAQNQNPVDVDGLSKNISLFMLGNSPRWKIMASATYTHPSTLVTSTDYLLEYAWGATDASNGSLTINGVTDMQTRGSVGTSPLRFGATSTPANFAFCQFRDIKIYDLEVGGTLLNHWPVDDNSANGGVIVDVVNGLDGTLTLGPASSWVQSGQVPLGDQVLNLGDCLVGNYQKVTPALVEDFSGVPFNDPQGAYSIDTNNVKFGTASARLSSPVNASIVDFVFPAQRMVNGKLGIWFRAENNVLWSSFTFFISSGNGSFPANQWANKAVARSDGKEETDIIGQLTGWNFVIIDASEFTPNGTYDPATAAIDTMRIRLETANTGDVIVDSVHFNISSQAQCLIMADDSHGTFHQMAKPRLDAEGYPATIYQTFDLIDNGNFASTAELINADASGWDICNHLNSHHTVTYIIVGITNAAQVVVNVAPVTPNPLIGDILQFAEVAGMTEINGIEAAVSSFDGPGMTITLNLDTTGFSAYTGGGKLRYSEAQLRVALKPMEDFMAVNGMTRGLKHFAYPTGAFDVEFHPQVFKNIGYKTARSINLSLLQDHILGIDNMYHLWARGNGQTISAADVIAKIDEAILQGNTFAWYTHGLTSGAEDDYFWDLAKFNAVIDHIVLKVASGELAVPKTISQWYDNLNNQY